MWSRSSQRRTAKAELRHFAHADLFGGQALIVQYTIESKFPWAGLRFIKETADQVTWYEYIQLYYPLRVYM